MKTCIHWFRQDLRLEANPALQVAASYGEVLPIFIFNEKSYELGGASRWWLHESLTALNKSLKGKLHIFIGDEQKILERICQEQQVSAVFWNRCYEPHMIDRDKKIKAHLRELGLEVSSFNGSLLHEPFEVLKGDGTHYQVFTPYYQKARQSLNNQTGFDPSRFDIKKLSALKLDSCSIEALELMHNIEWYKGFYTQWSPGESGAHKKLDEFLTNRIQDYKTGRDFPSQQSTSYLSPHLRWGEISPQQILQAVRAFPEDDNCEHFVRELCWREFSYSLLYHRPSMPNKELKEKFEHFAWQPNAKFLLAWQQGRTGYPIVDAGMRELWQTGYMHNRVRMICASFLVKNLLQPWQEGASWFWDCLVDADLANNSASWQWVAGCGTDAAPYFRIFNPITQGEKFDPSGEYTRHYLPELKSVPNKYLFKPWQAPKEVLEEAQVELGNDYPMPIVDVKASRELALDAYHSL